MIFYIGIFTFCVIMLIVNNHLKKQRDKRLFEIITLGVLCIISGTRYYLGGTDYYAYLTIFNAVPKLNSFNFSNVQEIPGTFGAEIGYLYINSVIKTLGINFFGLTLIHSIFFYTMLYLGLKRYTKNFNFLIIIFMYKLFFYNTFISMRQSITLVIFFWSIRYIQDKKPIKYFLCCTVAVLFHNGALILYLIYFINKPELSRRKIIILNCIFIPTIIISMLNIPILSKFEGIVNLFSNEVAIEKAENLINSVPDVGISMLHTFEYFLIMFLIIRNYEEIIKSNPNAEFIIKLFLCLLPIFTLFRGYVILTREKDYFTLFYGVILLYLCGIKGKKYYTIVQIVTIIICLYGFTRFIIKFDNGAMMPYRSYLQKDVSIFYNKY